MNMRTFLSVSALVCGLTLSTSAFALDANDFAQKFTSSLRAVGMTTSFQNVQSSGDTVTIGSFTFARPGEAAKTIDREIVFNGVRETGDGGYTANSAKVAAFTMDVEDIKLSVGDVLVEDLRVPAKADALANLALYRRILIGKVMGTSGADEAFVLQSAEIVNELNGDVLTGRMNVTGLHVDPGKLGAGEDMAMAKAFGLETIDANISGENVWNLKTGVLEVTKSSLDIKNVGSFNVTATVDGYDMALVEELAALQREIADKPEASPEEVTAMSQNILDKMGEKLHLAKFRLRFNDGSITGKIMAMVAAQNGTTPEVMAAGMAATIPMMAGQFGAPPALQTMLMEAATTFFKDPKSLDISLNPAEPVSFGQVSEKLPEIVDVITLLGLEVKANQ